MRISINQKETTTGTVAYRTGKSREEPALILIHGAVGDSRLFRYQLRHFGRDRFVIAPDLPGHGRSSRERLPDLSEITGSIRAIIREEEIKSFVLCGHSMGGGIALEMCRDPGQGLRGLVLVSTAPVLPVSPELDRLLDEDDMDSLGELMARAVFSVRSELFVEFAKKGLADLTGQVVRNDLDLCRQMDHTDLLGNIPVPVLLVANRGDLVVPAESTLSMKEKIPRVKAVLFDRDGHVPFFENSAGFNRALDEFFDEVLDKSRHL